MFQKYFSLIISTSFHREQSETMPSSNHLACRPGNKENLVLMILYIHTENFNKCGCQTLLKILYDNGVSVFFGAGFCFQQFQQVTPFHR